MTMLNTIFSDILGKVRAVRQRQDEGRAWWFLVILHSTTVQTFRPLLLSLQVPIFMRPPYGSHTAAVDATLKSLGFVIVIWTQDSGDSVGDTFAQEQANYNGNGPIGESSDATIPYNQPGEPGGSEFIFLDHDVQVRRE